MSKKLLVRYEPNPIPWKAPQGHPGKQLSSIFAQVLPPGKQRAARQAEVMLTGHAVDEATLEPIGGTVSSYNPALLDDPNTLHFPTNSTQSLVLSQVTSAKERHPLGETFYPSPGVQVSAPGYEVVILYLN